MIDLGGDVIGSRIGKLAFPLVSAVANGEYGRIRDRGNDLRRNQKQRGRLPVGSVPFGHKVNYESALVEDEQHQPAIKLILEYHGKGSSFRAVALRLVGMHGVSVTYETAHRVVEKAQQTT